MNRAVHVTFLCGLAACGGQAFEAQFAERQQPAMSGVLADLAAAPPRAPSPVILAVSASPPGLLLWDLREGRERWRVPADVRSTPFVAGDYVVAVEAEGTVVRRASDGARLLAIGDPELHLVSADGEGSLAVLALARGEGDQPLGNLMLVRDGGIAWAHELPLPVGAPAVVGENIVVPWAHQRLTVLDAADGHERLRLRLGHAVAGYALRQGAQVYVGQHRLFPLAAPLFDDDAAPEGLEPRGRPLPAQPPLLPDAYEVRMDADSAHNRVRLAWALADAQAAFADDALYFVFYRMIFGLAAAEDEVRWVVDRGRDVVGVDAVPGALVAVTEDGAITVLAAADGRTLATASLGVEVRAAEVRAAGIELPAAGAEAPPPLAAQLQRASALDDVRVGAGRALAIRFLARDASAEVTGRLIALCSDRADASQARAAACTELSSRQNGGDQVLAALHDGASFLDERPAPPSGALARASATMHLRQAVPFLVEHLEDPATPADELPGLFDGLARLGDRRAIAPIERFLRTYHADATDGGTIAAIGAAAEALLVLAADRMELVQSLSTDPLAPAPARERLARAVGPAAGAQAPGTAPSRPTAAREPDPSDDPSLPAALTAEMREQTLAPVEARLRHCLERPAGADPLPSARVVIMVGDDGAIQTVTVTPSELQACVEPLVRTRSFPRTRRGREVVTYTLRR